MQVVIIGGLMATLLKSVNIEVEGKLYQVIGGSFTEIVENIKRIEGRRFQSDRKVWVLPTLKKEEVLALLPENYQLLGDEEEVIDAEIAEIEKIFNLILEYKDSIQQEADRLWTKVKTFSFKSKSRVKDKLMGEAGCLRGAILASNKSVDTLSKPEILVMRKALEIMEIEF
jgi:hypothetical protein